MNRTRRLTHIALMTAIMAILAQMSVPLPNGVALTLQTLAVALCGFLLGARDGTLAVMVYLLLGTAGVPVFAFMRGGIGVIAGTSGGFLFGFIPMVALIGLGRHYKLPLALIFGCLAVLACHLCGVTWFSLITGTTFLTSFILVSAPFLLKDFFSVVLAAAAARILVSQLKHI